MRVIPFREEHLGQFTPQPAQQAYVAQFDANVGKSLEQTGLSFAFEHNGKILGCAGFIRQHATSYTGWFVLSADIGRHLLFVAREVNAAAEALKALGVVRLEGSTRKGFTQGERFLRLLGFQEEGTLRKYCALGHDYILFSRILTDG